LRRCWPCRRQSERHHQPLHVIPPYGLFRNPDATTFCGQSPHLTLDHPVSQALLNPALMRVLLTKVTPQNQASLMGALASRLRQVSLVSATQAGNQQGQGQPDQPRPAGQRFAVRQNDLAAVARPGAASYATALNALAR